jgi:hypothetical protein
MLPARDVRRAGTEGAVLTRFSYLLIAAVVAIAAAGVCVVLETDDATTNPPITVEQILRNAGSIEAVRQSGRTVTVTFKDDFDSQTLLGVDSKEFEATLDEGVAVEDVLRLANVPIGDGGVRVE